MKEVGPPGFEPGSTAPQAAMLSKLYHEPNCDTFINAVLKPLTGMVDPTSARICSSCGLNIAAIPSGVTFACPSCGELEINRCGKCRKAGRKYTCAKCGFTGP